MSFFDKAAKKQIDVGKTKKTLENTQQASILCLLIQAHGFKASDAPLQVLDRLKMSCRDPAGTNALRSGQPPAVAQFSITILQIFGVLQL